MKETKENSSAPSLFSLTAAFFKIGLTAYGMAILQQLKALIIGRKWLTRRQVDEGLGMVQMYPGPIMYNLATYSAYRTKGFSGAMLGSFFFLLPSYVLMVVLSWVYFNYGLVSWIHPLFIALEAMVVGIVAHIFLDFGNRYLNSRSGALIGAIAFFLMLFKVNAFWVIFIAIVLGIILLRDVSAAEKDTAPSGTMIPGKFSRRLLSLSLTGFGFLAILGAGMFFNKPLAGLLLSMFKIGAVAFGSGFTIMPLLQQEAVISHHWLSMKQFADGIALGQITPGPFLITATFIGYKVGGIPGSALATFGMFFPSFFYTLIVSEIYGKIKHLKLIRRALHGVLASFTGMLLFVLLSLGKVSLTSPLPYIWAVGAFILVRYYKLNILWIFLLGIALAIGLYATGVLNFIPI